MAFGLFGSVYFATLRTVKLVPFFNRKTSPYQKNLVSFKPQSWFVRFEMRSELNLIFYSKLKITTSESGRVLFTRTHQRPDYFFTNAKLYSHRECICGRQVWVFSLMVGMLMVLVCS